MDNVKKLGFSAVIFDLDGTLIDSEPNYIVADTKLLAKFGIEYTPALRKKLIGRGIDVFSRILIEEYGVQETPQAILAMKDSHYMEVARTNTRVFPEMRRLLDMFRGLGLPMALASGSSQPVVDELLALCGVRDYFKAAISSVGRFAGKPDPGIFLETARILGFPPAACLVLEDSPSGVAAALAADMKVVAIPSPLEPPPDPIFARAHILYPGGMDTFSAADVLEKLKNLL